jgi:hypothetical protein
MQRGSSRHKGGVAGRAVGLFQLPRKIQQVLCVAPSGRSGKRQTESMSRPPALPPEEKNVTNRETIYADRSTDIEAPIRAPKWKAHRDQQRAGSMRSESIQPEKNKPL